MIHISEEVFISTAYRNNIENKKFTNCKFLGVHFDSITLKTVTFENCEFRRCVFTGCYMSLVKVKRCAFLGSTLFNCEIGVPVDFEKTIFFGQSLIKQGWFSAQLKDCAFYQSSVREVGIISSFWKDVLVHSSSIINCTMEALITKECIFQKSKIIDCDFTDSTISTSLLSKSSFFKGSFDDQTCFINSYVEDVTVSSVKNSKRLEGCAEFGTHVDFGYIAKKLVLEILHSPTNISKTWQEEDSSFRGKPNARRAYVYSGGM